MRALRTLTAFLGAALFLTSALFAQTAATPQEVLNAGRNALRQKTYAQAIRVLEDGRKRYPNDTNIKLELGRAYLYNKQDKQAVPLFREVLRDEPANRSARLELARALGYQRDYKDSDQLYVDLLASNPDDEAASLGYIRNLIHERRLDEARGATSIAISRHPQSQQLREYQRKLDNPDFNNSTARSFDREPNSPARKSFGAVQGSGAYFADSAANRSWRSTQGLDYQLMRRLSTRIRTEERSLWISGGPKANVSWGTAALRFQVMRPLTFSAAGGAVRFADGGTRTLFNGEVELHPTKHLWLTEGFSRRPISPTYNSTQFKLLAEGWHTRLEFYPHAWWVKASWYSEHYSDGNRGKRFEGEVLRWIGPSRFSAGAGYRFNYLAFDQSFVHGYFNPSDYRSHLARGGLRFRLGQAFHAEYLGGAGVESVAGGTYQMAWEVALRNRAKFENWEFGADYFYFRLAQSTGAFNSQAGRLSAAYYF